MIHQLDINGNDKVDKAIMRLKTYEPEEGYYLCFSGGKDSCAIKALADMAGVKYDAHYNVTGIDPPELVQFIKTEHADVEFEKPYERTFYSLKENVSRYLRCPGFRRNDHRMPYTPLRESCRAPFAKQMESSAESSLQECRA